MNDESNNKKPTPQPKLAVSVEIRSASTGWRGDAVEEFRRTGMWTAWVGGGPKTSYRHPDEWEHPYLK